MRLGSTPFLAFAALAVLAIAVPGLAAAPVCSYQVVASYPHDSAAFTQGLVYHDGWLLEGTGLWGESSIRRVELTTGTVQQQYNLPMQYFGEGIAVVGERLVQLTYRARVGFVYDLQSFALVDQLSYSSEGWGLANDGSRLIMSDGSATLHFWDPVSYQETGQVQVTDDGSPVIRLNELEAIAGEVFANVWLTDRIARINPRTGQVLAWIDLTGLLWADAEKTSHSRMPSAPHLWSALNHAILDVAHATPAVLLSRANQICSTAGRELCEVAPTSTLTTTAVDQVPDVLNGIAYDTTGDRLFVTGKRWPLLFEIELVGCPPLLLLDDGFESGDLSAWKAVMPAQPDG